MSAAEFTPSDFRIDCARKAVAGIADLAPLIVQQLVAIAENGAAIEMVCRIEQLACLALSAVGDDLETGQSIEALQRALYAGMYPIGASQ